MAVTAFGAMSEPKTSQPISNASGGADIAARVAALAMLEGVFSRAKSTDDQFEQAVAKLEPRDRAFVRLLVAPTLRRLGQIDLVLGNFVERRPPDRVINVLRLGAAQLLFIATPPHAAVAKLCRGASVNHFTFSRAAKF